MSKHTQNWKNNEKILCALYEEFNIPVVWEAKEARVTSKSTYDCRILLPSPVEFQADAKFSRGGFRHHALLEEVERKYSKRANQKPYIFCRTLGKHWGSVTLKDQIFMGLLAYWLGTMDKSSILKKWGVKEINE